MNRLGVLGVLDVDYGVGWGLAFEPYGDFSYGVHIKVLFSTFGGGY